MSKILEMIEKRNKAWEGAKAFLESKRDKDGLISEEDALSYDEMEKKVHNYSLEIERLQKMEEMDKELSKPMSDAIVTKPMKVDERQEKKGRARDEYKESMLAALRTNFKKVSDILQEGVDADGGYLVPEEYDSRLIETLEEENIMRGLATVITTSGQHKINIAMSDPAAAWIEEGGALNFGDSKFAQVLPEEYTEGINLRPSEFSDIGQAEVFVREYQDRIRFSPSTGFLVYNDSYWEESELKAQGYSQELVLKQLEEIYNELLRIEDDIEKSGIREILASMSEKKALAVFNEEQKSLYYKLISLQIYKKYAVKRGDTRAIHAALKESKPMLEIDQRELDTDEFLLNTPSFTVDLKTGECRDHKADDYITKETSVDPSDENMDIWLDALDTFFVKDKELIEYVQKVAGISLIGKVYIEALIIAYGDGRNGKSTFWNTISRVLNLYSGSISADILTVNSKRNAKPELAETRGKRLLIAAELQEGLRLNTSNVKQLCSTDEIVAEKKYRDPFKFIPSHTLVLYTNHLPRVGALDEGTWRRLIVIPFEAKIEGTSDIKNYTDYLVDKAGGAVLKWLIEGAKKAIDEDFKFSLPKKVADAINEYKESNNWFKHFLNECCEIDSSFEEKSGEVYQEYRAYCLRTGDYVRSTTDFYSALSSNGFMRRKTNQGIVISGLKLKSDFV